MNVIDSSAWLEYFSGGRNAGYFQPAIEAYDDLVVPSICVAEVFKRVRVTSGRSSAFEAVAQMRRGQIVPLDRKLAIAAATVGVRMKLAMADSIVLGSV